ncbi:MAG: efflux RND transporter periplasmic adaptor subunit [Zavarzinella sp.]
MMMNQTPILVSEQPPHVEPPSRLRYLKWVVLALIVGAAGYAVLNGGLTKDTREELPPMDLPPRESTMVTVDAVQYRPVQRSIEAIGSLHPFEVFKISSQVEGKVQQLYADVADQVGPQHMLLQIDPTDYQLAVNQDQSALVAELSKIGISEEQLPRFQVLDVPMVNHARLKMEHAKQKTVRYSSTPDAFSIDERTNAKNDYELSTSEYANQILQANSILAMAKMKAATLELSRKKLKDTHIMTPDFQRTMPGVAGEVQFEITKRHVSEGMLLRPGTEVYELMITQVIKLKLAVPERYMLDIQPGQKVLVEIASQKEPVEGVVRRINPSVNVESRTVEVEVDIPNPTRTLKPGSFARAKVLTRVDNNACTVPLTAIYTFLGKNRVFVIEQGKVKVYDVELGIQTRDWVEIVEPKLPKTAQLITSGHALLSEGMPVQIRGEK